MNPKFKEGDLVEYVEFHLHPNLPPRPRPHLENTLGIILKQLPPEKVWYDWANYSEAYKETALKPENNCYVWFSQQDLKEFTVFEDELKEVKNEPKIQRR